MAKEVGLAPFDFRTARENGYRTLAEGMTFIVRHQCGAILGTVGMVKSPLWYSRWPDHYQLTDSWFYVIPEARGGKVGVVLLRRCAILGGR
jgi:GNAT superfamily N-acetyltransferase